MTRTPRTNNPGLQPRGSRSSGHRSADPAQSYFLYVCASWPCWSPWHVARPRALLSLTPPIGRVQHSSRLTVCTCPRAARPTAQGMALAEEGSAIAPVAGRVCSVHTSRSRAAVRTIAADTALATTGPYCVSAPSSSSGKPATPPCRAARTPARTLGTVLMARAAASPGASVPTAPSCS